MNVVRFTTADGHLRETPAEYLFLAAGGPDAGKVWVRSPAHRGGWPMRPAEPEEIGAAEANIPGFKAARQAATKLAG